MSAFVAELPGVFERECANGAHYLRIHYSADPGKDKAWADQAKAEMSSPREWEREMELDDSIYDGEPVFRTYLDSLHSPVRYRSEPIPIWAGSTFYGGWDCGPTHQHGFALAQLTKHDQVFWMGELAPKTGMGMATFAPMVMAYLKRRLPGQWSGVLHFGDESGKAKSGTDYRSAFEIGEEHGFLIKPVSNNIHNRQAAVEWLLTDWISQEGEDPAGWIPRCAYGHHDAPVLVEGMRGAYHMQVSKQHEAYGPGMQLKAPAKTFYSHVNDAHQYPAVKLWQLLRGKTLRTARRY